MAPKSHTKAFIFHTCIWLDWWSIFWNIRASRQIIRTFRHIVRALRNTCGLRSTKFVWNSGLFSKTLRLFLLFNSALTHHILLFFRWICLIRISLWVTGAAIRIWFLFKLNLWALRFSLAIGHMCWLGTRWGTLYLWTFVSKIFFVIYLFWTMFFISITLNIGWFINVFLVKLLPNFVANFSGLILIFRWNFKWNFRLLDLTSLFSEERLAKFSLASSDLSFRHFLDRIAN